MLLDAGADPNGRTGDQGGHGGWTALRCAVAGAANPLITALLLERGAVPGDHDLYLAGFADDNHECLRLLLFHAADVARLARMALAAPISINDAEGVQLLLAAGADPDRYADDADPPSPVVYAAVRAGCSAELTGLLLGYGANPDAPGPDGRSPYALAAIQGRTTVAMLLRQHGAAVGHHRRRPAAGRLPARGPSRGRAAAGPKTPGCSAASPPRSRPRR